MKKKEREHLKEDPLVLFFENLIRTIKKYQKHILLALGSLAAVLVIFFLVLFFRNQSINKENRLYSDALNIKNSETLSAGEKLEALGKLKVGKGLSSMIKLFSATIYFEEGELETARKLLDQFEGSRIKTVNDNKEMLDAEVYLAMGQWQKAMEKYNGLLADKTSTVPKDIVLYRIAKIQSERNFKPNAISNLKKLLEDFPQSTYSGKARALLETLENQ